MFTESNHHCSIITQHLNTLGFNIPQHTDGRVKGHCPCKQLFHPLDVYIMEKWVAVPICFPNNCRCFSLEF